MNAEQLAELAKGWPDEARPERGLANSFRHLRHVRQFVVTRRLAEPAD